MIYESVPKIKWVSLVYFNVTHIKIRQEAVASIVQNSGSVNEMKSELIYFPPRVRPQVAIEKMKIKIDIVKMVALFEHIFYSQESLS